MSIKILAFAAVLAVATAALAQPSQLEVNNAWAGATPGKAENGAAYVTIQSPTADRLVSASTPVAKKAELHTMSMQGMVMKMRPLAGVDIPAGHTKLLFYHYDFGGTLGNGLPGAQWTQISPAALGVDGAIWGHFHTVPEDTITHRNADMVRVARDPDAGRRTTRMAVNVGEALLYHTKNSCLQLSREPA